MRKAKKNRQNVTVANQFTVKLQKVLIVLICLEILFSKSFLLFKPFKIVFLVIGYQVLSVQYWGFQQHSLGQSLFAVSACFALC
jgi:hypothetical protein